MILFIFYYLITSSIQLDSMCASQNSTGDASSVVTYDFEVFSVGPEQALWCNLSQGCNSNQDVVTLAQLINKRLAYMKDVAAYKWVNHLAIEDLEREQVVLESSIRRAKWYKLDSLSSRQFFEQQIYLAKEIQKYWFDHWKQHGFENDTRADLNLIIRPALISLGDDILQTIHSIGLWNFSERKIKKARRLFVRNLDVKGVTKDDKIDIFKTVVKVEVL